MSIGNIEALVNHEQDINVQPHSGKYHSKMVDQCRDLVARRYLDEGYVSPDEVEKKDGLKFINGKIDHYVEDSEYFWKTDEEGKVVATLRVIHLPLQNIPSARLPIEQSFELYTPQQRELRQAITSNPTKVIEISALAKERSVDTFAALDMYRAVWQHAKRTGIDLCAISADERLDKTLKGLFGSAVIHAGVPAEMMGSVTVPSFLYPSRCADAMSTIYRQMMESGDEEGAAGYYGLIEYLRDGLEPRYFSTEEKAALAGIGMHVD